MGEAIGEMLPNAIGVGLSALAIVAVVLMLVTKQARVNGPAFVVGWCLSLGVVGTIALQLASGADASEDGEPATWVSMLKLIIGLILLLLAFKQWQGRPTDDEPAQVPGWMDKLDTFGGFKAGGAGVLLGGVNPKNLLLTLAGAVAIAGTGISSGEQAAALLIFVLIASITVITPVVIYFLMGDGAEKVLDRLKDWLVQENAVIMTVLLLVIGVKLIGDAISGLT